MRLFKTIFFKPIRFRIYKTVYTWDVCFGLTHFRLGWVICPNLIQIHIFFSDVTIWYRTMPSIVQAKKMYDGLKNNDTEVK